jgi:hypothetical protein
MCCAGTNPGHTKAGEINATDKLVLDCVQLAVPEICYETVGGGMNAKDHDIPGWLFGSVFAIVWLLIFLQHVGQ